MKALFERAPYLFLAAFCVIGLPIVAIDLVFKKPKWIAWLTGWYDRFEPSYFSRGDR